VRSRASIFFAVVVGTNLQLTSVAPCLGLFPYPSQKMLRETSFLFFVSGFSPISPPDREATVFFQLLRPGPPVFFFLFVFKVEPFFSSRAAVVCEYDVFVSSVTSASSDEPAPFFSLVCIFFVLDCRVCCSCRTPLPISYFFSPPFGWVVSLEERSARINPTTSQFLLPPSY